VWYDYIFVIIKGIPLGSLVQDKRDTLEGTGLDFGGSEEIRTPWPRRGR